VKIEHIRQDDTFSYSVILVTSGIVPPCILTSYITETMEFHPVIPVLYPIKIWLNYSIVFRKASGLDFRSPGKMFCF